MTLGAVDNYLLDHYLKRMPRDKIAVVLVGPRGDANIGATARAMKNFGIRDLRLVESVSHLTDEAFKWSVNAKDILHFATTYDKLDDALKDLACAVAFTRRLGRQRRRHMDMASAIPYIRQRARSGGIALVFGREDKGLSNEEISSCDVTVTIPTSVKLPSLNLAQSVIIACYEIFTSGKTKICDDGEVQKFVTKKETAGVLKRLSLALDSMGYGSEQPLKIKILHRFEKLFGRGGLTVKDVRMFEGLIARIIS